MKQFFDNHYLLIKPFKIFFLNFPIIQIVQPCHDKADDNCNNNLTKIKSELKCDFQDF
jgi:hypothetical protein